MLRLASSRVPQLRVWRKAPVIARIVVASLSRHLRDQSLSAGSKPGSIHADDPSFSTVAANTDSASTSMSRVRSLYKSTHKARSLTSDVDAGVRETLPAAANIAANLAAGRSSCAEDGGSVPDRPLTALQRRQLLFKNKAAFVLAPNALRRVEYLLAQYAAKVKGEGLTDTQVSDGNVSGGGNVCMDRGASSHDNMTRDEVCAGKKPSLSKPPLPVGIRIGVRRRGCSGYSYTVNYYFAPRSRIACLAPRIVRAPPVHRRCLVVLATLPVAALRQGCRT